MTIAQDKRFAGSDFVIEDISTGMTASGFGVTDGGRRFSFRIERRELLVEVYRPLLAGPVPHPDDVIAATSRNLIDIDVTDERSLAAAVHDLVADLTR